MVTHRPGLRVSEVRHFTSNVGVRIHVHMHIYIYTCVFMYLFVSSFMQVLVYLNVNCICKSRVRCRIAYIYIRICMHIHIYTYMFIHMHILTYININVYVCTPASSAEVVVRFTKGSQAKSCQKRSRHLAQGTSGKRAGPRRRLWPKPSASRIRDWMLFPPRSCRALHELLAKFLVDLKDMAPDRVVEAPEKNPYTLCASFVGPTEPYSP